MEQFNLDSAKHRKVSQRKLFQWRAGTPTERLGIQTDNQIAEEDLYQALGEFCIKLLKVRWVKFSLYSVQYVGEAGNKGMKVHKQRPVKMQQ